MPSAAHSAANAGLSIGADVTAGLSGSVRVGKPTILPDRAAAQATYLAPATKSDEVDALLNAESNGPKIKRGAAPPEFTPKDSFDPEIFNRRYIKQAATDGSPAADKSPGGK